MTNSVASSNGWREENLCPPFSASLYVLTISHCIKGCFTCSDMTGNSDGSVRLWEWGHHQPLAQLRPQGSFPKVTKVLFNSHGNKSLSCHNKTTSDFVFVGSSSLIATAGHSSESRNICIWDTLLPQPFTCHEHGSPALVYAPHHQLLISGGRKGEICIFDIRQRQMRHTFQAHESSIRSLAIDPEEEYFVTGSADGDIKS
ncbi:DMXL2-like protein [Mya arenaria]|uniref:DMXL2-like protein n=1 Tax=Mya arenaria TaxID=6604 RepID=A0ABY7DZF5_MYAAR|nr:DMXL2-like protein [Mya arenaria]